MEEKTIHPSLSQWHFTRAELAKVIKVTYLLAHGRQQLKWEMDMASSVGLLHTLWQFNIAMEHDPCVNDLRINRDHLGVLDSQSVLVKLLNHHVPICLK